ncbi:hypothetical protein [Haloarcula sp. 1CSR25-25]|uniref:hypothetical protein n=1 Tax=Haloarcula sp. 1CSR25-25 TaxID=2862545 RepID=UPI002894CF08|nr:hypothetical protein [Haloarcula sp. 1CSR25-25]MDT3437283.1 hypothetical protein [Haloarcula sp. 1CSR25-25]
MNETKRRVLNTLLAQTNEYQGEWTSRRSLFTVAVGHTDRSPENVRAALDGLIDDRLLEDQGERYRLTDSLEAGEIVPPSGVRRQSVSGVDDDQSDLTSF